MHISFLRIPSIYLFCTVAAINGAALSEAEQSHGNLRARSQVTPAGWNVVNSFKMHKATVTIYQKPLHEQTANLDSLSESSNSNQAPKRNLTKVDLTPASPTSFSCYAGEYGRPSSDDCDVVIAAQLYNSSGRLTSYPGYVVSVAYGTCVTVFQNPRNSPYLIQYNWTQLGETAQKVKKRCLTSKTNAIGGEASFEKYLTYQFDGVMISLQGHNNSPTRLMDSKSN